MLYMRWGGPTWSFTVHGPEEFDKPRFIGLGEKIRHCSFVVAVSSYTRSQLYRWVEQRDWPKVKIVHCGLERAYFADQLLPVPIARRLVCVGRLCEQKGQLLLLEAARRLVVQGVDFELVLAGDGEMRGVIDAFIMRHNLQGMARITGWSVASRYVTKSWLRGRSSCRALPRVFRWSSWKQWALQRPGHSHIAWAASLKLCCRARMDGSSQLAT